jgi:hypothetical protein
MKPVRLHRDVTIRFAIAATTPWPRITAGVGNPSSRALLEFSRVADARLTDEASDPISAMTLPFDRLSRPPYPRAVRLLEFRSGRYTRYHLSGRCREAKLIAIA